MAAINNLTIDLIFICFVDMTRLLAIGCTKIKKSQSYLIIHCRVNFKKSPQQGEIIHNIIVFLKVFMRASPFRGGLIH